MSRFAEMGRARADFAHAIRQNRGDAAGAHACGAAHANLDRAPGGSQNPGGAAAPAGLGCPIRARFLSYGLAGFLAVCFLPASIHEAWAQCYCGPPGIICCNVGIASGCEPITTPAAREMCPVEESSPSSGGVANDNVPQHESVRGRAPRQPRHSHPLVTRRPRPPEPAGVVLPRAPAVALPALPGNGAVPAPNPANAGDANAFQPATANQIAPLRCPKGFAQIGVTFYGGTQCGPAPAAAPPAPEPPPAPAADSGPPPSRELNPPPPPERGILGDELTPKLLRDPAANTPNEDAVHAENLVRMHDWFSHAIGTGAVNTQPPPGGPTPHWLDVPRRPPPGLQDDESLRF